MTIGGTPVTVDKDGVHVQSGTLPTGAAVDGVNKILLAGTKRRVTEILVQRREEIDHQRPWFLTVDDDASLDKRLSSGIPH